MEQSSQMVSAGDTVSSVMGGGLDGSISSPKMQSPKQSPGGAPNMVGVGRSGGEHRKSPAGDKQAEPRNRPDGGNPLVPVELDVYLKTKGSSFYPSETVSLFCRHLAAAVEVTDTGIRAKRLRELWKELFTTASYKLLEQ